MAKPATPLPASNKAKIARRVVEVLEYFDEAHPEATVMDLVRRYDRPQSSTSELMMSMVELGLLQKDHVTRAYKPTPRTALIGTAGQHQFVRDGSIVRLIDRLVEKTGLSVSLTTLVGLDSQIVHWRHGPQAMASTRELASGVKEQAQQSAAGLLMLSTIPMQRREGIVRRLNAEAPDDRKFQVAEVLAEIQAAGARRYLVGPIGFGSNAWGFSTLMPRQPDDRPMALNLIYGQNEPTSSSEIIKTVGTVMRQCLVDAPPIERSHAIYAAD
ncbi:DNA-binding IclR family transcriptional regulator [Novosphingobium sp. PhB165]|uniref:helix-turn-helix domain-containing protein n=1 Tax=Novosphingobium sp. PhB165 TaxID=2485105 RepID=UPI00104B1CF3|nr:helix-turn-helix domain-containing protein [Novosphingobium sp. PhB165]TCM16575.1 DNA-binding IclR family transcriptional regulator [Novosphingobium sp. PhB165]